jgi:hypothetical protein
MTDDDKAVNQRIVATRRALDLARFAQKIKISNSYMGAIELGNPRVNDRIIKIISLGVTEV